MFSNLLSALFTVLCPPKAGLAQAFEAWGCRALLLLSLSSTLSARFRLALA
jgi:hypothetical protein